MFTRPALVTPPFIDAGIVGLLAGMRSLGAVAAD